MKSDKINLGQLTDKPERTDQLADRIEGIERDAERPVWGEDFSASGGKAPPPPSTDHS